MTEGRDSPPRTTSVTPAQKYDRQIRVWGEDGQAALEQASICLINAGPTGTETLKNLVLPGIGSFTVIDGSDVDHADYGNNFFLTARSTGPSTSLMQDDPTPRNRALVVMEAMHELNESVEGSYIPQDVSTFIRNESEAFAFFTRFSVVIVTQMGTVNPTFKSIAAGCYKANVPLLLARANGLVGYLRLQARELCILDAKEDDLAPDLRLHSPFEELEEYTRKIDFPSIEDSTVVSHIPFVVILAQAVAKYRQQHDGKLPASRSEKDEFAEFVKALKPESCPDYAENFEEALKRSNLRLCYADAREIPYCTRSILTDPKSNPITDEGLKPEDLATSETAHHFPEVIRFLKRANRSNTSLADAEAAHTHGSLRKHGASRIADESRSFWLHVAAIRDFTERYGRLPLQGSLPDMAADTESYIKLQRLYTSKADADAKLVAQCAAEIADRHSADIDFDEESVRRYCKHALNLRVYRTRSIVEEVESRGKGGFKAAAEMDGALDASRSGSAAAYYALLRAADRFMLEHGREAGTEEGMREADVGLMYEYLSAVKEDIGVTAVPSLWRDEAAEVVRYAGTELHNVCAYMGGIAAQEVTKILTRQFVPLDNTLLVNFAEQTSVSFAA